MITKLCNDKGNAQKIKKQTKKLKLKKQFVGITDTKGGFQSISIFSPSQNRGAKINYKADTQTKKYSASYKVGLIDAGANSLSSSKLKVKIIQR